MANLIKGTAGQDTILGTQGADSIQAGAGSDYIYGFLGADTIDGGTGYDTLFITGTSADLNRASDAQLLSVEEVSAKLANGGVIINLGGQSEGFVLTGSAYNDALTGGHGVNYIDAGDGDDTIYGFGASDTINGGTGSDTLILNASIEKATDSQITNIENVVASSADKGLVINLGSQSERFYLIGSAYADDVTGGSGGDVINTGAGDDKIHGFLGNDYVNGGDGSDTLYIAKTSPYLNAALDVQLVSVETISAAEATSGVIIDLSAQSEGFTIIGSNQADYLKGGSGNDTFIGTSGMDTLDGGPGYDTLLITSDLNNISNAQLVNIESISAAAAPEGVIINLGAQNERLNVTGSRFADTITSGIGIDLISAGDGDDVIKGFANADSIDGGAGLDTLVLTATSTALNNATDSQLTNVEVISASAATMGVNINLSAQSEAFLIIGSANPDTLIGGDGADSFYGFNGSDVIDGGKGVNTLFLQATSGNLNGAADSQLVNVEAISAMNATSGVTISLVNQSEGFSITGGSYADHLTGTLQDDTFIGFKGADTIDGGAGTDTIKLTATSLDLNRASNAQIVNVEKISAAGATSGVLIDVSNQTERIDITGGSYDDTIIGGIGAINGGAGQDTVYLTTDLSRTTDPQLMNVETVSGALASKGLLINLSSQSEAFAIIGGTFTDTMIGGAGNDSLSGGGGSDVLTGGAGADHFVFNVSAANNGVSTLVDFTPSVDVLDFSHAAFAALGDVGPLLAVKFWSSTTDGLAHSADDRLIYNSTTGDLYYDADGTGSVNAIKIAVLTNAPHLSGSDIFVVN